MYSGQSLRGQYNLGFWRFHIHCRNYMRRIPGLLLVVSLRNLLHCIFLEWTLLLLFFQIRAHNDSILLFHTLYIQSEIEHCVKYNIMLNNYSLVFFWQLCRFIKASLEKFLHDPSKSQAQNFFWSAIGAIKINSEHSFVSSEL